MTQGYLYSTLYAWPSARDFRHIFMLYFAILLFTHPITSRLYIHVLYLLKFLCIIYPWFQFLFVFCFFRGFDRGSRTFLNYKPLTQHPLVCLPAVTTWKRSACSRLAMTGNDSAPYHSSGLRPHGITPQVSHDTRTRTPLSCHIILGNLLWLKTVLLPSLSRFEDTHSSITLIVYFRSIMTGSILLPSLSRYEDTQYDFMVSVFFIPLWQDPTHSDLTALPWLH